MRIAILWRGLNGYLNACLRELASRPGVELFVVHTAPESDTPFDIAQFAWMPRQLCWSSPAELHDLAGDLESFTPDIIVLVGWTIPEYRKISALWKSRAVRVLCMDNTWHATLKQWIGVLTAPFFVRRLGDKMWVPGERQTQFARRLGFRRHEIAEGLYAGDIDAFTAAYRNRSQMPSFPPSFVFVGRLVPVKGVSVLAEAYRRYRLRSLNPWPLVCLGEGPLASLLENQPGVTVEGFIQPEHLPEKLMRSSCLILPSSFEPWAVVVHEAAAAGLVILASHKVGAVPHLVREGENGFTFEPHDVDRLVELMERVSSTAPADLERMGAVSHQLSKAFTPRRWADTLLAFRD